MKTIPSHITLYEREDAIVERVDRDYGFNNRSATIRFLINKADKVLREEAPAIREVSLDALEVIA